MDASSTPDLYDGTKGVTGMLYNGVGKSGAKTGSIQDRAWGCSRGRGTRGVEDTTIRLRWAADFKQGLASTKHARLCPNAAFGLRIRLALYDRPLSGKNYCRPQITGSSSMIKVEIKSGGVSVVGGGGVHYCALMTPADTRASIGSNQSQSSTFKVQIIAHCMLSIELSGDCVWLGFDFAMQQASF